MKIVLSAVLALFLVACSDESPKEIQKTEPKQEVVKESVPEVQKAEEKSAIDEVKEQAVEAVQVVSTEVEAVVEHAQEGGEAVAEEMKVAAVKAVQEVSKEVTKVTEVAQVAVKEVQEKAAEVIAEAAAVSSSSDGETLYKACVGCHGATAEKAALGKSQVVKGWKADKIEAALNGYKDGSYGAAMKGIMAGQVSKLSAEDIKALSEYISKF